MALHIRFQHPTGTQLGYSIERLADGFFYDFTDSTFRTNPSLPVASLPEDVARFLGRYQVTLDPTPISQFSDGDYAIGVHDRSTTQNIVIGLLGTVMRGGNDATVFPSNAAPADPWAVALPGSYALGTAGAILGQNLDVRVSTRSTYAGGSVASVTAPVTVGVNNDKNGYLLAGAGLDAIAVETGINARQALTPILAAAAGVLSGAGTGTITIHGANGATTRITATTDDVGNRSSVTLSLPS